MKGAYSSIGTGNCIGQEFHIKRIRCGPKIFGKLHERTFQSWG